MTALLDGGRKRLGHEAGNGLPGLGRQVLRLRVLLEGKLCPDDEVDDSLVEPVRPIVVQDLVVVLPTKHARSSLGSSSLAGAAGGWRWRRGIGPAQPADGEVPRNGTPLLGQPMREAPVGAQLRRHALEQLEAV